ncbi:NADH:ubiquinone oxidoreductase subunit NDUFA12 [Sphingomonas alba]|uniref:NADH:ubiquinone oxidoreductase subunit NDUFA12 n=1 Tax=Sphingomonas alba TaxID=2908208 RepID=A0ABT0RL49_9SPHN|nr:NADH:ubiquinone oxidoreductase subunit NDUFA12 [Sphingomonas alba]MCL6683182.1 NADH:ubiquinone oxidoreductase subunit NDUFA12 [Sphingomonas alba]
MGWLANAFTWWNGASWGTSITTRRHGREVGRDEAGNVYFQHKDNPARRWVIYAGNNDGSVVPPGWQSWLRGTIDDLPEKGLPTRRTWEKAPIANLTGSGEAWVPSGSLRGLGERPATTGDYSAWTPDEA